MLVFYSMEAPILEFNLFLKINGMSFQYKTRKGCPLTAFSPVTTGN